ncbi:otospiralin-like [Lepisosteus oculatus]|uniref:otospiralin-like n=1 Tax=Lepisosteus oculatus TaxID=7918 RepID=UPI00074053CD|nr:PREDICTED: otospiralin-like [Lepisosteus oculatus]
MSRLCACLLLCTLLYGLVSLIGADSSKDDKESRDKRSIPNWGYSASDFFGWIENLRNHAGYDKIDELARTFWAHFPSASRLGYDSPESEE